MCRTRVPHEQILVSSKGTNMCKVFILTMFVHLHDSVNEMKTCIRVNGKLKRWYII